MRHRIESLKQVVQFGLNAGKKNMIVDLDVLGAILGLTGPIRCEHGVEDGEWCEDCNRAMKQALINNQDSCP